MRFNSACHFLFIGEALDTNSHESRKRWLERGISNSCGIPYCELCDPRLLNNAFLVPQGENMSSPKQSGLSENTLGALAYFAVVPAIFFLALPRYKKSSYVRFHAMQAIEIAVATIVITYSLAVTLAFGPLVYMGLTWLAWFGLALTCYFCGMMALRGETVRLPIIGAWTENLVNSTPLAARTVTRSLVPDHAREVLQ